MNFKERLGAFFGGEKHEPETPEITEEEKETVEINPFSTIKKPDNEDQLAKLERKLDEYKGRSNDSSAVYKIAILEKVLNNGAADYESLKDSLSADMKDNFKENDFFESFRIISSYASGNMKNLRGGTGLK